VSAKVQNAKYPFRVIILLPKKYLLDQKNYIIFKMR
jgi:hypothetical protein